VDSPFLGMMRTQIRFVGNTCHSQASLGLKKNPFSDFKFLRIFFFLSKELVHEACKSVDNF